MRDDRLRSLERTWRETGEVEAERAWLHERARVGDPYRFGRHTTQTPAVRAALEQARRASVHDRPLVIVGAGGSGRTELARAIHDASGRAGSPCVLVPLAAMASGFQEADLFGVVKGAITGQSWERPGAIEDASGGTLIIECPPYELDALIQNRLRMCLEDGCCRRVGGAETYPVEVRFVFEVKDPSVLGDSLQESLDWLEAETLVWPALGERRDDLSLILDSLGLEGLHVREGLLELLSAQPWVRNLHELEELLVRARSLAESGLRPGFDETPFEAQALGLLLGLEP